jgi:hypothetical protein
MVEDHEVQLGNSVARLERLRSKHERLAKVLVSAQAGVQVMKNISYHHQT